jgi:signal transduction histidine kinase
MVESWGGEVTIESRVGVGTTVRVTLRVSEAGDSSVR